ncbi:DUF3006 domain-containing protein [Halobacterium zhouii]|uniref:DUF3006 domain-containing protein n=1 Tax=Halobacterium zhouii TaxID=2902624 RepID=UPI001E377BDE|nr:DUF3006 domain-containing protein [Halobacterium zhouii]
MTMDGTYTTVVDRFEGERAVLLLEDQDETAGEMVVDQEQLPETSRHVDAVVTVEVADGEVVDATYEKRETEDRSERAQRRFDELSRRPPSPEDESDSS